MFKVSGDVLAAFCSEDGKRGNDERVYIQLPVRIYIKRDGTVISENTVLVNASPGGAYFGSNELVSYGEELEISISMPRHVYNAALPAELTGRATVVSVESESAPEGKMYGIGVRFNGRLTFRTAYTWPLIPSASSR